MTEPETLLPEHEVPRHVIVAGGGVAGLEACLALRAYAPEQEVRIELLSPARKFEYRPLAVLEPFGAGSAWSLPLERFARDQDVVLRPDGLASVDVARRCAHTTGGAAVAYHALLVAIGARPRCDLPGALTFRGSEDSVAFERLLDGLAAGRDRTVAFVVPDGAHWSLPIYELALMTAARLGPAARDAGRVTLVTPEPAPLHIFGVRASAALRWQLEAHGIALRTEARAVEIGDGELGLADGERIAADRVVALPRLTGRPVAGLPHNGDGFLPVDKHGRVCGAPGVYAAGDLTTFPFKQGGIATQQADVSAEAILAQLGFAIEPRPFQPVLQGVLLSDRDPAYMRATIGGSEPAAPRAVSLWWPPSKIAGRYLSPYLTVRAGAPRTPEVGPTTEVVPVEVDVEQAVRAVRSVVADAPEAVPVD